LPISLPMLGKKKYFHTETRRHGEEEMNENEIDGIVVDGAVKVHMQLGPGLLESMRHDCRNFGEILMKDGISRIIKWQTGMTSLFFSVSPCEAILSCRVTGNRMD